MTNPPSTEERVWAALSHISALAFGMGLLLPVLGWSEQRRKSKYASFHCLQALGYQSLGYTVWMLSYLLLMIVFMTVMIVGIAIVGEGGNNSGLFMAAWMPVFMLVMFGFFGMYFLLPLIAAISCAFGKDFRYPVMGNRLARYLGYDPTKVEDEPAWLIEKHEDRWISSMGHFSVILPLWGILAPATVWLLQGKRSLFLKFQSIQTVTYQGLVNVLYMGSGMIYMFGFVIFIALTGFEAGIGNSSSPGAIVGLIALIISIALAMGVVLLLPLFHILGQWAGYRVLKGDDYHYPLVGKMVERWLSPRLAGSQTPPEQYKEEEKLE